MQMSGRLALGPVSGEVTAGSAGIAGKVSANHAPLNPGINQQQSYSLALNRDGLQSMQTEGFSYGAHLGYATTQTVTISVSNDMIDTVGSWFGLAEPPDDGKVNVGGGF